MRGARAWLLGLMLLGVSCSTDRNPADLLAPGQIGVIVVDAQLIVGEEVPRITLRTTQRPDTPYDPGAEGLRQARVQVTNSVGDTIDYLDFSVLGGRYLPDDTGGKVVPNVLPNTTYYLRVVAPDGRVVTAQTTTPDSLRVRDWVLLDDPTLAVRRRLATRDDFPPGEEDSVYTAPSNQLIYQDGLLEAQFDRGSAGGFQVGLFSLDFGSPLVIDADFLSEEDKADLDRETSSPPFVADESSIRLPWFAIFFEGRYDIRIYSVDRNWYDLARSLQFFGDSNFAFGSNAGDDFERPIFHVNGGIGLFGSAARDEIGFTVHPRP